MLNTQACVVFRLIVLKTYIYVGLLFNIKSKYDRKTAVKFIFYEAGNCHG